MYFGFNDDLLQVYPWAPSELNPTAFRFGMPWDAPSAWATDLCANMNLGAYTSGPSRIGIMALCPGMNGALPNYSQFNAAVTRWVNATAGYPNFYIQVWNEPNNPDFGNIDSLTVRGFISAANAAGGGRVIGPAMSPAVPNWQQYMSQAYADKLVAPAVHMYPTSSPWTGDWDVAIKEAGNNNPSPTGPIYITEIGLRHTYQDGNNNWVTL